MSQYDLAAATSEIICSQAMTEITCSIVVQPSAQTGQGNVCSHGNDIGSQCMSPSLRLPPPPPPPPLPSPSIPALFFITHPRSRQKYPRAASFLSPCFHWSRGVGQVEGRGAAARGCCEFHGWMCVGVKSVKSDRSLQVQTHVQTQTFSTSGDQSFLHSQVSFRRGQMESVGSTGSGKRAAGNAPLILWWHSIFNNRASRSA